MTTYEDYSIYGISMAKKGGFQKRKGNFKSLQNQAFYYICCIYYKCLHLLLNCNLLLVSDCKSGMSIQYCLTHNFSTL